MLFGNHTILCVLSICAHAAVAISKPTMNATIVFMRQFAEKHCKLASTLSREALPLPDS